MTSLTLQVKRSSAKKESWQVSTWAHRAWLACGCTTVFISLSKSLIITAGSVPTSSRAWLKPISATFIGYILADLASGIYHWAIDNYGSAETPIFGSQIDDFQGHHKQPWAITEKEFACNLHSGATAVTIAVFSGCVIFAQQFHAWAHTPKAKLPPLVVALQDAGIILARGQHAAHHRPPYNNNYCIVSGMWNRFLDKFRFFVALEVGLFHLLGVRPRSWSDPNPDWTQETQFFGINQVIDLFA